MADPKVTVLNWLRKQLDQLDTDLVREMLKAVAEYLMSLEAETLCGAAYGEKSLDRVNHRNGYRSRRWDTRTGTIDLAIPRLRRGSYFPEWLLAPRRRAEKALVQVVSESYVNGVSTRRVDRLARSIRMRAISDSWDVKGTIHYMAPEQFADFRKVGPPADIYALGKILFEVVEGKIPPGSVPNCKRL